MSSLASLLTLFVPLALPAAPQSSTAAAPAVTWVDLNLPTRRDYAFDSSGILYITAGGSIERYDTGSGALLAPHAIGGSLLGIDLSPDGNTLAVADEVTVAGTNRIHLVDVGTGASTPVTFPLAFGEGGTYMVAWGADGRILITSRYDGSGWVPLRRHDPQSGITEQLGTVRQNTMLTPNATRRRIALAEANISSGPVRVYDVPQGEIVATRNTGWFMFEVAISSSSRFLLAPSYDGAFVLGRRSGQLVPLGTIGQYATWGPIGAVFSPTREVLFTADWGTQPGLKAYALDTFQPLGTLDPYPFPWNGNHALGQGRMEISPDGNRLAVSIQTGVRVYRL